jgi:hypothetical protein
MSDQTTDTRDAVRGLAATMSHEDLRTIARALHIASTVTQEVQRDGIGYGRARRFRTLGDLFDRAAAQDDGLVARWRAAIAVSLHDRPEASR